MEIVERTDRYLTIIDRNNQSLWGLLLFLLFLNFASIVYVTSAKVTALECQRNIRDSIDCKRTISGIFGSKADDIYDLRSVTVVQHNKSLRVILKTATGDVEAYPYGSHITNNHYQIVARLNAFIIDRYQNTLRIEQDDRLSNGLMSVNFIFWGTLVGLFRLIIPMQVLCQCDRQLDRITLDKKYLLYGDRRTVIPLSAIASIELKESGFSRRITYDIQLIDVDGKKTSLSVPTTDRDAYRLIVNKASNFLYRIDKQSLF
jgi:hypothetical protein